MEKLESTRRRYAEVIRDLLWQRHRLRLSDTLVSAFARIPREDFLGPPPWLIHGIPASTVWQRVLSRIPLHQHHAHDWTTRDPTQLYRDVVVAIDPSRGLNNGQPSGVATWLHLLELQSGDRVLHVGCGLGYYTAIMAAAVAPGEVIGVELDPALASQARANLTQVNHVTIVVANGTEYDSGPVDAILVTHAHGDHIGNLKLAQDPNSPQALCALGPGFGSDATPFSKSIRRRCASMSAKACSSLHAPKATPAFTLKKT